MALSASASALTGTLRGRRTGDHRSEWEQLTVTSKRRVGSSLEALASHHASLQCDA